MTITAYCIHIFVDSVMRNITEGYRVAMKALVSDEKVNKGENVGPRFAREESVATGIRHTVVAGHKHHS
jgi:hypothetical protein